MCALAQPPPFFALHLPEALLSILFARCLPAAPLFDAGGNLGFETAAFKITKEHLDIMGGSVDTESFQYFSELVARAFLLLRDNKEALFSLVSGMADAGFDCFHFPHTLQKVRACERGGAGVRAGLPTFLINMWGPTILNLFTSANPPLSLLQLWERFRPDDSELQACRFIVNETQAAVANGNTTLYDGIQKLQNNIHSEAWQ